VKEKNKMTQHYKFEVGERKFELEYDIHNLDYGTRHISASAVLYRLVEIPESVIQRTLFEKITGALGDPNKVQTRIRKEKRIVAQAGGLVYSGWLDENVIYDLKEKISYEHAMGTPQGQRESAWYLAREQKFWTIFSKQIEGYTDKIFGLDKTKCEGGN
jgi:hypothetical protein